MQEALQVIRDIHSLMKDPRHSNIVIANLIDDQVMFNLIDPASLKPILARSSESGIGEQQANAALQTFGIDVHLRRAPRLQGVLQDVL